MKQKITQLTAKLAALYLKPESQPSEFEAIRQKLAELRTIYYQTQGRVHGI